MAFGEPAQGEPETLDGPVFAQSFECVLRACGGKPARRGREGRDAELVEPHEKDQREGADPFTDVQRPFPEFCGLHVRWFLRAGVLSRSR